MEALHIRGKWSKMILKNSLITQKKPKKRPDFHRFESTNVTLDVTLKEKTLD
ncbi:MAG: hypothetical protein K9G36_04750 [Crocinitomicaceae bacterium]|jgi:hypothetical protein|nr:hypothetical protein [Crocinitomicaceae bacterium]MCF8445030.1 hypothetical protein [Crocinitomicaceae bacterium]